MRIISPMNINASTRSTQNMMFCMYDQKTGYKVIRNRTAKMGVKDPVAKINIAAIAVPLANRSYLGCFVSTPRYSEVAPMVITPITKAAHKTCDWKSAAITTSLLIPGISMSPTGIEPIYLLLPRGGPAWEVRDPDHREQHVDDYGKNHQNGQDGHERSPYLAVSRLSIQPRDRKEDDRDYRRDYYSPKRYEHVTGEEHQHLVVEEEEPLRARYVARRADIHRLREGRGYRVRQENNHCHKNGRNDDIY